MLAQYNTAFVPTTYAMKTIITKKYKYKRVSPAVKKKIVKLKALGLTTAQARSIAKVKLQRTKLLVVTLGKQLGLYENN